VDDIPTLVGRLLGQVVKKVGHGHPVTSFRNRTTWVNPKSTAAMKMPTVALIAKTSTVRFRTCSRVGQVTFLSSE
jgi:hypothetical protein